MFLFFFCVYVCAFASANLTIFVDTFTEGTLRKNTSHAKKEEIKEDAVEPINCDYQRSFFFFLNSAQKATVFFIVVAFLFVRVAP